MAQNWTSIIKSNWIFSEFYLLICIYIYIYIYICMYVCMYLCQMIFFLVIKKAHKYKIIQTLSSSNFISSVKSVRYMIMFI